MSGRRAHVLVADSGAFIKGVPMHEWSEKVITVREVVNEIRDYNTRQRLRHLPYKLEFRVPAQSAIRNVTEFSKKTGDYRSLSAVDLQLLALVYQMECEYGPERGKQLRSEPLRSTSTLPIAAKRHGLTHVAGFYKGLQDSKLTQQHTIEEEGTNVCNSKADQSKSVCHSHIKTSVHAVNKLTSVDELGRGNKEDEEVEYLATSITKEVVAEKNQEVVVDDKTSSHNSIQLKHGEGDRVIDHDDEDDDDDDGGWITPENFKQICDKLGGVEECPVGVTVCCLTADYAMQNVLLQMGLNVFSMEGMLIRELRTYALKCTACFKPTLQTDQVFCPSCGNKTLVKVVVNVNNNGAVHYQLLSERQLYSHHRNVQTPPLHRGGRAPPSHIHAPDVKVTFSMPRCRDNKVHPLDPEYIARGSPFQTHDISSKGAQMMFGLKRARGKTATKRK